MTTSQIPAPDAAPAVDPDELARHIAQMYRDVANEAVHQLHVHTGRHLAEALGIRPAYSAACRPTYGAHTIELLAVKPTEGISK